MNEFKPPVLVRDQIRADLIEAYLARDNQGMPNTIGDDVETQAGTFAISSLMLSIEDLCSTAPQGSEA